MAGFKTLKNEFISYVGVYCFSLFAIGSITPLIGQYLDHLSYTGLQIGIITSAATALGAVSAPLWSVFYEKRNDERLMLFFYGGAAVSMILLIFVRSFFLFLLIYALAFSLEAPIRPLNDARLLKSRYPFGDVRLWGSVGFAAGVFLASRFISLMGYVSIFVLYGLSLVISGLFLKDIMRRDRISAGIENGPVDRDGENTGGISSLLKNRPYLLLILSAFFINGTCIANNTYFGFLYRDSGGSINGMGSTFLLMVLSEAPFMYFSEKLLRRIPVGRLLLVAMLLSAVRFLVYGLGVSHLWLVGTFFLPGIVNGFLWVLFAKYVAELVQSSALCSAITLYTAVGSSISTIACQFFAGIVLDHFGSSQVYLMFAALNLVSVLIFLLTGLFRPQKRNCEEAA